MRGLFFVMQAPTSFLFGSRMRAIGLFFLCLPFGAPAQAQQVTQLQLLTFGRFALVRNDMPYRIVIAPHGGVSYDSAFVPDESETPRPAEYFFEGLPANTAFTLGVTMPVSPDGGLAVTPAGPVSGPGGQLFTLSDFLVNNDNIMHTNGAGEGTIYVGATLTTTGNGLTYGSGSYTGQYQITLYY